MGKSAQLPDRPKFRSTVFNFPEPPRQAEIAVGLATDTI